MAPVRPKGRRRSALLEHRNLLKKRALEFQEPGMVLVYIVRLFDSVERGAKRVDEEMCGEELHCYYSCGCGVVAAGHWRSINVCRAASITSRRYRRSRLGSVLVQIVGCSLSPRNTTWATNTTPADFAHMLGRWSHLFARGDVRSVTGDQMMASAGLRWGIQRTRVGVVHRDAFAEIAKKSRLLRRHGIGLRFDGTKSLAKSVEEGSDGGSGHERDLNLIWRD